MKSANKIFACLLLVIAVTHVNAQKKTMQATTICSTVEEDESATTAKNLPLVLYMQDSVSNQKIAIVFPQTVLKKMIFNPKVKLVNQKACISGILKSYNNQPAIFIDNEKQVKISEPAEVNKTKANSGK